MQISKIILLLLLVASQSYGGWFFSRNKKPVIIYGIEKSVYDSLTEQQQQHIIDVYNGHEAVKKEFQEKIAFLEKQQEHIADLEKERDEHLATINQLNLKVESQQRAIANFLAVSEDLLEAEKKKKHYREREKRDKFYPKIMSIKRGFNSTTILLQNETLLEISPFEREAIEAWITGQTVVLEKGDGLVYTLQLTNLDTENSVAVKIKESP